MLPAGPAPGPDGDLLSRRELEIGGLAGLGLSNREIAEILFVSVRTVEGHLYRIYAKLGVSDRRQLAHLAAPASSRTTDFA